MYLELIIYLGNIVVVLSRGCLLLPSKSAASVECQPQRRSDDMRGVSRGVIVLQAMQVI